MVTGAVTWGLFTVWVIHDVEEALTMPAFFERRRSRLRQRWPGMPGWLARRLSPSRAQIWMAIGLVGLIVLAAAATGAATGGRSFFFQAVLAAFGLHALAHAGQALAVRGYAPGVITAVILVAPFSWWAWHQLDLAHAVTASTAEIIAGVAALPILLPAAYLLAELIIRPRAT